jgi:hypothetical protein
MLTISIIPLRKHHFEGVSMRLPSKLRVNYGFDRIRYPAAVLVGARIRVESALAACTLSADSNYVDIKRIETIEIEAGDRPAAADEAPSGGTSVRRPFRPMRRVIVAFGDYLFIWRRWSFEVLGIDGNW